MKKFLTLIIVLAQAFIAIGQEVDLKYRESFIEGSQLMEEYNYSVALDIWLDILKSEPENANVNFKAGVCLWKLPKRKQESLPYFEKAVKSVDETYDPFDPNEKGAPLETYFYIANAYHLHYQLDSAIVFYNKFKNHINHNHEFWARTELDIKMCETAKEAILNPVDIKVVNLGELVNSEFADYAPVISVDESAIYFTSKRMRKDSSNLYAKNPDDGEFYEDIYVSYKGEDGAWNDAEQLNFNTSSNEATLSLSADGENMYIYKSGEKGYGDIYMSKLNGLVWTDPQKVGSDINTEYHETHASVSPDGRRLYFISNRKGSLTFPDKAHEKVFSKDIYFANLLPTGDWALSQPVTELNTPFHEDGVFLHPDGKTMFFSSEGHNSIGGYDIFVSEFQEDSTWGKPENIGYPLNTTDDDIFFVTNSSGKRAYYSSIRDEGYGEKDIFVISMLSFKEKPLTLLIGRITSADGSEVPEEIYIHVTDNETGEPVGTFKPRARDKKFTIIIPPGSDYHLDYTYNDSVFYKDDIFVPENSAYQEIEKGISLGAIDFGSIKKPETKTTSAEPTPKSGAENPNVEGKLTYGTAGAAGVLLNLTDNNKNKIGSTTTDGSGNFVFKNLEAGSQYYVAIDPSNGQVPENAQLYVKDSQTGAMLPVSKMSDGSFGFTTLPFIAPEELAAMEENDESVKPQVAAGTTAAAATTGGSKKGKKSSAVKNPKVEGNLKYGAVAAGGVLINLNDNNKNKVASTTTDGNGNFAFANLNAGSKYGIAIDPSNGTVPADAHLSLIDSETGEMLAVSKLADGSFAFETLPYMAAGEIAAMDVKDEKIAAVPTKKTTPAESGKNTMPAAYKTEVQEIDGEKYIIHEVVDGETMFSVSLLYNLKFPVVQESNPGMGDLIHAGDQIKLPIPAEVMFYQEFFDYNVVNIKVDGQDYLNFLTQVETIVKERGKATLMISSSSSKVPSARFNGNETLSVTRADNAKQTVISSMADRKVTSDKLNFADMSTLVRGPEFQNDAQENKATYKNYQYVKIIVK